MTEILLLRDGNPPASEQSKKLIAMVEEAFGNVPTLPEAWGEKVIMDTMSPWYGMTNAEAIEAQSPLNR